MNVDLLKQRKLELGLTNQEVSSLSGVSLGTINKIFSGATQSPRLETVEALSSALGLDFFKYRPQPIVSRMCDSIPAYKLNTDKKENGTYTVEDWCAIPEDVRAELIDGFLIYNEVPTITHQAILGEIVYYITKYTKEKKCSCKVYFSPIGVCLDKDNQTMLEPDLIVLCDPSKSDGRHIHGAPDFVLEVVSPSSRSRDYLVKLNKYYYAGVREYWIVDPKHQNVSVYLFHDTDEEFDHITYSFEDKIPVGIFGDLIIDFKELDI